MDATLTPTAKKTERHVSRKLWVGEIREGTMQAGTDTEPNTLITARGPANRVNVLGVVVSTEDLPVSTLVVDDSTGTITVRSFDHKLPQQVGMLVQIIGRPRQYQGEIYITAEAVAAVNKGWAAFRKAELGNMQRVEESQPEPVAVTETPVADEPNKAERIISIIRQLDDGSGAAIEQIVAASKLAEAEQIIEQLLLHGDIFELRPGKVKVL